jgi:hypothetical protein
VTRHLLCLTIDTDPDGLAGKVVDRQTLSWRGLEQIDGLLDSLAPLHARWGPVPVTWFVRADGQLRDILGSSLYLLERFEPLWGKVCAAGHELGWHPHLYRQSRRNESAVLITDPGEAVEEITKLWDELSGSSFQPTSFRNGEGWHYACTMATVEALGFRWDSTAVPGRVGTAAHPMNWTGTPNHPYFPDKNDIRQPGDPRSLLEIPMNTWHLKTSYDSEPRLRYMNPAVHEELFTAALRRLRMDSYTGVQVWTFILHPGEVLGEAAPDQLYARSVATVCHNLDVFADVIRDTGHGVEFVTVSRAGAMWLQQESAT